MEKRVRAKQSKIYKGVIYIIINKYYPDYFKIGRTSNIVQRLHVYNSSFPIPCIDTKYISLEFNNTQEIETLLLTYLGSSDLKNEWYTVDKYDRALLKIIELESIFALEQ